MGGVDIDFKFPKLDEKFAAAEQEINLFLAAQVQANRGMLFDSEGSHNGRPGWAPLKFRVGQILSDRGTLRKSLAPRNPNGSPGEGGVVTFESDAVVVGTTLLCASLMNDGTTKMPGGKLVPVNAKALKIPLPQGMNASATSRKIGSASLEKSLAEAKEAQKTQNERHADAIRKSNGTISNERMTAMHKASNRTLDKIARIEHKLAKLEETGKGGDKFIFRKSVRIPARPFDDWSPEDQAELNDALAAKVAEVLRR